MEPYGYNHDTIEDPTNLKMMIKTALLSLTEAIQSVIEAFFRYLDATPPTSMTRQTIGWDDLPGGLPGEMDATPPISMARQRIGWDDLPGEMKNQIYSHALSGENPIYLRVNYVTRDGVERYKNHKGPGAQVPSLLLVNRKTYLEGAPILFRNHIEFEDPWTLQLFGARTRPSRLAWLHTITLHFDPDGKRASKLWLSRGGEHVDVNAGFRFFLAATGLRKVVVDVPEPFLLHNHYRSSRLPRALEKFLGHGWLRGLGRDGDERVARIGALFCLEPSDECFLSSVWRREHWVSAPPEVVDYIQNAFRRLLQRLSDPHFEDPDYRWDVANWLQ